MNEKVDHNIFNKRCVLCGQRFKTTKEHIRGCQYCEDGFYRKTVNDGRALIKTIKD